MYAPVVITRTTGHLQRVVDATLGSGGLELRWASALATGERGSLCEEIWI